MKISEVTLQTAKKYIGLSADYSDDLVQLALDAAKNAVKGYTGLDDEQLDSHEDITAAYLMIANDIFSSREYSSTDGAQINPTAAQILDLHSVNLLPKGD